MRIANKVCKKTHIWRAAEHEEGPVGSTKQRQEAVEEQQNAKMHWSVVAGSG
jgi:hypothetical protein